MHVGSRRLTARLHHRNVRYERGALIRAEMGPFCASLPTCGGRISLAASPNRTRDAEEACPLKAVVFFCALLFAVVSGLGAEAAELIMTDSKGCRYCREFHREIGKEYGSSQAGQIAPLWSVSPHRKWPADL